MGNTNCRSTMQNYILDQSFIYYYRYPISIIITIILALLYNRRLDKNPQHINYVFYGGMIIFTVLFIEIFSRFTVDNVLLEELTRKCRIWQDDPMIIKSHPINTKTGKPYIIPEEVAMYKPAKIEEPFEDYDSDDDGVDGNVFENFDTKTDTVIAKAKFNNNKKSSKKSSKKEHMTGLSGMASYIGDIEKDIEREFETPSAKSCLSTCDTMNLCSDSSNPRNLIAPTPGPQWLPLYASTVQHNLSHGKYTPSYCNLHSIMPWKNSAEKAHEFGQPLTNYNRLVSLEY